MPEPLKMKIVVGNYGHTAPLLDGSVKIEGVQPEVRDWEPREALVDDGQTEALALHALDVLRPGAPLVLEIHAERAQQVSEMLVARGYEVRISSDLTGRDRVVVAKKRL